MAEYKFRTGQSVTLSMPAGYRVPVGPFSIVKQLPEDNRGNQYRLKSTTDGHERVASESDLSAVA